MGDCSYSSCWANQNRTGYKTCTLHCSWRELSFLENGKKYPGRLKDDSWGSGVVNTKDLRPVTPQMKKGSLWSDSNCFRSDLHWSKLLLAAWVLVLGWMFKVPSAHHDTDVMWSKWVVLFTQRAQIGDPNIPGILEVNTNWPEVKNLGLSSSEDEGKMICADETTQYNQLPENEKWSMLWNDGSCHLQGCIKKWMPYVMSHKSRWGTRWIKSELKAWL